MNSGAPTWLCFSEVRPHVAHHWLPLHVSAAGLPLVLPPGLGRRRWGLVGGHHGRCAVGLGEGRERYEVTKRDKWRSFRHLWMATRQSIYYIGCWSSLKAACFGVCLIKPDWIQQRPWLVWIKCVYAIVTGQRLVLDYPSTFGFTNKSRCNSPCSFRCDQGENI